MRDYALLIITSFFTISLSQAKTLRYNGEAFKKNQLVYREFHEVIYDKKGNLQRSKTEYKAPDGSLLSEIESDFSNSHSAPAHVLKDFTSNRTFGIRYINKQQGVMFHKNPNEEEKVKELPTPEKDELLVAGQGLNYFIVENLDYVLSQEKIPIKFLLPSVFDYFRFTLQPLTNNTSDIIEFQLKVKSFWLKLFAPKMLLKYDKLTKRIIYFKGLSNIREKNGDRQVVEITYSYDN